MYILIIVALNLYYYFPSLEVSPPTFMICCYYWFFLFVFLRLYLIRIMCVTTGLELCAGARWAPQRRQLWAPQSQTMTAPPPKPICN